MGQNANEHCMLGMVLIVALPTQFSAGRLVGYYLTQATPTPFIALLSLISTNFAGYTKKTTVAAMYLIAYCAGNIIGPQLFRPQDAPQYRPAEITIICCWVVCLLDMLFILYYYRNQNKKKAAFRAQVHYSKLENQEWLDLVRFYRWHMSLRNLLTYTRLIGRTLNLYTHCRLRCRERWKGILWLTIIARWIRAKRFAVSCHPALTFTWVGSVYLKLVQPNKRVVSGNHAINFIVEQCDPDCTIYSWSSFHIRTWNEISHWIF